MRPQVVTHYKLDNVFSQKLELLLIKNTTEKMKKQATEEITYIYITYIYKQKTFIQNI